MAPSGALPLPHLLWLLAGLILIVAPHALRLPWWMSAAAGAFFLWRAVAARRGARLPARWLLLALAIGGVISVYFNYRTIFGRDAGVALLVLLIALKLMEMQTRRDVFVVAFLAYFLVLTNFFYSQTIPTAALMFATVLVVTSALVGLNALARPLFDNLRTAGWMLVQAGPVMLLLFLLFPRVQGPLWGLPQDAFAGTTGLSDTMTPGDISRLLQSDAIAFRVKFSGSLPRHGQLYWRGPVLWRFDGRTWRAASPRLRPEVRLQAIGAPVDYEVTLEPHNRNWLFALDLPARIPQNARVTSDYQLISLPPVRNRIRYGMRSFPNYVTAAGDDPEDLAAALALPREVNPRARALAAEWRRRLGDDAAIVQEGIEFFRSGRYEYTLLPPLLGANSVDEFLFDTKQGFCEHFSSSFAFLMRAAGVPARIVTGYQGGEMNPVDGYLVVRQTDAHAWVEVELPGRGWIRVDPTGAAVPLRIDSGISAAVPRGIVAALPLLVRTNMDWLRTIRDNWEALANGWNQWVLGYNTDRQREVLSRFGVPQPDWSTLAMMLFWSVGGVLLAVGLWLLRGIRRDDPVQRAWLRFCDKLRRADLARASAEGPLDYAARVTTRLPERESAVRAIADLYVELRYGAHGDPRSFSLLKRLVREFRP
jgi:protein-glutamine gamma-glutamyltransferase